MAVKRAGLPAEVVGVLPAVVDVSDAYVVRVGACVFETTVGEAQACWDVHPADLRSGVRDGAFILWSLDVLGCRVAPVVFQRRSCGSQTPDEPAVPVSSPESSSSNERGVVLSAPFNPDRLRAERQRLRMSQSRFADAVREAGSQLGEPNACTKRLVQKWERGVHATISWPYQRALARVTGWAYDVLCDPAGRAVLGAEVMSLFEEVVFDLAHLAEDVIDVRTLVDPASTSEQVRQAYLRGVPASGLDGARLRAARVDAGFSQSVLALELRKAGERLGDRNACTKRLVQKWEKGEHRRPQPVYQAALEAVLHLSYNELCVPAQVPTHEQVVARLTQLALDVDACRTRLVRLHARLDYGY